MKLAQGKEKPNIAFNPDVMRAVLRRLYNTGRVTPQMLTTPECKALINETYKVLNGAIGQSITQETPAELTHALRENAFIFSGFKAYHNLREIGLSLTEEDGTLKPFAKFAEDVNGIDARYNQRYLYAEYNHAVHTSQMAVKWNDFTKDGDEYNLQYRTAGDERVRSDHARLDGVTLPPSDKFWNNYLPPNGWNCRCQVVQVLKDDYPVSDSDAATQWGDECTEDPKAQIFRYNAGKEMEIFPPRHPYFKAPAAVGKVVKKLAQEEIKDDAMTFVAKTVAEAEEQFRSKLGVKCDLRGFKKDSLTQVKDIFDCVAKHFKDFPELKEKIKFVGSVKGRIKMLEDALFDKYRKLYPGMLDEYVRKRAHKDAVKYANCSKSTYAYSAPGQKDYGLNGLAFNTDYSPEKFRSAMESDQKIKYHPIGCNTVKSIFDHELGHKMDEMLSLYTDADFKKIFDPAKAKGEQWITDNLSHYAYDSRRFRQVNYTPEKEFIAEAWSEYLNNPQPRAIAKAVGELIEKKYGEKKKTK